MSYRKQIRSSYSHLEVLAELEAREIAKAKNIIEETGVIPAHLGISLRIIQAAYARLFADEV